MKHTIATAGTALLLAAFTFLLYAPSLQSDFVYDSRTEILQEGFITSLSNLPAVLTLQVMHTNLLLAARPGEILYLMLNAALWGRQPWGYHLASNLLHAANVALLFLLLVRLTRAESAGATPALAWKSRVAAIGATLLFAAHPVAVEAVSAINFSSDLLVAFFILLALLVATLFQPGHARSMIVPGTLITLCAFAVVTVKESGIVLVPIVALYWFLFRRGEARGPWLVLLGAATGATAAFLPARFLLMRAVGGHPVYLGGSLGHALLVQPRIWVFMLGKLLWPLHLSADYTLDNVAGLSLAPAILLLACVLALHGWLALRSRVGAVGVAIFWLGLATVSNFVPLFCISADRYYYLPLVGATLQLMALLSMTLPSRAGFGLALASVFLAVVPLAWLTLQRQQVFATDLLLWSDTVQVSPTSAQAHSALADALLRAARVDEAVVEFQKALAIAPGFGLANNNIGVALLRQGRVDEAIGHWRLAIAARPEFAEAYSNLGNGLAQKGQIDEALANCRKALELNPYSPESHYNLGLSLMQKGQKDDAIAEYRRAAELNPGDARIHNNLGVAYLQTRQMDLALAEFQDSVAIDPRNAEAVENLGSLLYTAGKQDEAIALFQQAAQLDPANVNLAYNLGVIFLQQGRFDEAITQLRRALQLKPKRAEAHHSLAVALYQKGDLPGAIAEFQAVVQLKPGDAKALSDLAKAQTMVSPAPAPK